MHMFKSHGVAAVALAAYFATSPVVLAFDKTGNTVADTFLENMEAGGATDLTAESVTGDSDRTVITGLKATVKKEGKGGTFTMGTVTFENGNVEDGRLRADRMIVENITMTAQDGMKITVERAAGDEVVMPSAETIRAKPDSMKSQASYRRGELSNLQFTTDTGGVIPIEAIHVTIDEVVDDVPTAGKMEMTGLTVSKDALDGEGKEAFSRFGYDQIVIGMTVAGKWEPDNGLVHIEEIKVVGADVGTLTITGEFGGFTKDVIEKLENNDNPQEAMQVLQGATVSGLSIRIDNDSIVERALTAQGKEMGGLGPDEVAAQLSGALPLMLNMLQNKEFEAKVATAAGTFLRERKSIAVVASPANPVPMAQILGAAMVAPLTLPTVLSVDVSNP